MIRFFPSGDSALIIKTGNDISLEVNSRVRQIFSVIRNANIPGVIDFIQSYNELMIIYDPLITGYGDLHKTVKSLEVSFSSPVISTGTIYLVPVLYGGESGPDLEAVGQNAKINSDEVVSLHTGADYTVYMLGFTPGFCYLGGLDRKIAHPRRKEPRLNVKAGSVGIAGEQTGIYSVDGPGGWQIIGKTPLRLFDPLRKPEFLFRPGDRIRFCAISKGEYAVIDGEVRSGVYTTKKLTESDE